MNERVDWVDYAKGFCIIMVVMMHSTLGVEKYAEQESWAGLIVAFATPFRMPDFFLISGLFLARVIDRDWRTYLDKKVVHFLYFYAIWVTIQFVTKAPGIAAESGWGEVVNQYALAWIEPFGTLWFIYLLPIFFVFTKALRNVSPWIVWPVLAALEIAPIHTGWVVPDEFSSRFVYFYTGYIAAPFVFRIAATVIERAGIGLAYLAGWAVVNGIMVFAGLSALPFLSLALGLVGAGAVVVVSALLSKTDFAAAIRYCGRNSIVIYLAFFLPMAVSRTILLKTGIDLGLVSLIVTASGVVAPLVLFWIVRGTALKFLFERPAWARLQTASRGGLVPAE